MVGHFLRLCSIPVPAFLADRITFEMKVLCVDWCPCLATADGLFRFHLQVPYSQCCESQIRSPPLILECPRISQVSVSSWRCPYLLTSISFRFPFIFMDIWTSLLSPPLYGVYLFYFLFTPKDFGRSHFPRKLNSGSLSSVTSLCALDCIPWSPLTC